MDVERQTYISQADALGSMPAPAAAPGKAKAKKAAKDTNAESLPVFLDKLGERIAFERTGTRLYSALITKYLGLSNADGDPLLKSATSEPALEALQRIRAEELQHFHLLCEAVTRLGGDPTAQTPSADATATASSGLMQVITDPRTTLVQALNAILSAELTDNAGWELLGEFAAQAGQAEMAEQFSEALRTEERHLETVRGWIQALLLNKANTAAV
jgi:hypothetical protein